MSSHLAKKLKKEKTKGNIDLVIQAILKSDLKIISISLYTNLTTVERLAMEE